MDIRGISFFERIEEENSGRNGLNYRDKIGCVVKI